MASFGYVQSSFRSGPNPGRADFKHSSHVGAAAVASLKALERSARSGAAATRVRLACLVLRDLKAGFREDQPRWPKGSGEDSGRWSGGEGSGAFDGSVDVAARGYGHHYVPRSVFNSAEFGLSSEVRSVLNRFVSGSLGPNEHLFTEAHRQYNRAVIESLRNFLQSRGISGSAMTIDQAMEFGLEVLRSKDARISDYNKQVLRRRLFRIIIRYYFRGRE